MSFFIPSEVNDAVTDSHAMEEVDDLPSVVRQFECAVCGAAATYDPGTGHVQGSATYLRCGARGSR